MVETEPETVRKYEKNYSKMALNSNSFQFLSSYIITVFCMAYFSLIVFNAYRGNLTKLDVGILIIFINVAILFQARMFYLLGKVQESTIDLFKSKDRLEKLLKDIKEIRKRKEQEE